MLEYPTTGLMLETLFANYGILSGSSNMLFIGDLALWMGLAETLTVERQPARKYVYFVSNESDHFKKMKKERKKLEQYIDSIEELIIYFVKLISLVTPKRENQSFRRNLVVRLLKSYTTIMIDLI